MDGVFAGLRRVLQIGAMVPIGLAVRQFRLERGQLGRIIDADVMFGENVHVLLPQQFPLLKGGGLVVLRGG